MTGVQNQRRNNQLAVPHRLQSVRDAYVGTGRESLPTPSLIVDLPKVRQNLAEMARRMDGLPAALRPHAKIHKSPILGQMQLNAGAIGLTTATVWEASAMIEAGLSDVLIANQVVGSLRTAELARIADLGRVIVAVDSERNAAELSDAAGAAGSEIHVIVEIDVGLHRSGVRSIQAAVALGQSIQRLPRLRLAGLLGYEGHCMLEPDREIRVQKATASNHILVSAADEFERAGLPTEMVAGGGLGTWDITGANPRITEIHAGSYIFSDAFHRNLVPGFDPALTVQATIISRDGSLAVVDCGRKSIGIDRTPPEVIGGVASVRFEHGEYFVHEEHTALELADGAALDVGDKVELMPGYAPTTVNLYDMYFVVDGDTVVDVWPIHARYGSATAMLGCSGAASGKLSR
jgi:D-serine deaminase-like pyridoxal phosphate-dependent protein